MNRTSKRSCRTKKKIDRLKRIRNPRLLSCLEMKGFDARPAVSGNNYLMVAAILALSLRALFPAGFMPGDLSNGTWIEICHNGLFISTPGGHHPDGHQHGGDGDQPDSNPWESCDSGVVFSSAFTLVEEPTGWQHIQQNIPVRSADKLYVQRRQFHLAIRGPPLLLL